MHFMLQYRVSSMNLYSRFAFTMITYPILFASAAYLGPVSLGRSVIYFLSELNRNVRFTALFEKRMNETKQKHN